MALSQQQIQQLKSAASPQAQNNQAMNDDQFSSWAKPISTVAPPVKSGSGIGGVIKSIISAPATMLARPFQAGAELAGASSDQVNKFSSKYSSGIVAPVPQNGADVKKDVGRAAETVALGAAPITGGALFGAGHSLEEGNNLFSGQTLFQTVLGAGAGKVLDLIGKPIFDLAGKAVGKITPDYLSKIAAQGSKAVEDFASAHNILPEKVSNLINSTAKSAENLATKPFNAIGDTLDSTIKAPIKSDPTSSIEAVNPDLTGKKLTNAYKQTVSGSREVTPSSIFREQGLTPDQQTINLGTRLQDLNLGKDPVQNLNTLKTALDQTEAKVTELLKGDPEINYNANKSTLYDNLNHAKTTMPREFSSIKDSKSVFNNVMDFANETVSKAEDSIMGIRDARTAFDAQAKAEYPSAFKEGKIDTSTPAGRAIKTARDIINEHLYNTAPNGSEIQKLIGRESDIFRATDNIAPKAAKGHGANIIKQFMKNHPTASKVAGAVVPFEGARKLLTGSF